MAGASLEAVRLDSGLQYCALLLRLPKIAVGPAQIAHQFAGSAIGVLEMLRCARPKPSCGPTPAMGQLGSARRIFASTNSAPAYGYDPYGRARKAPRRSPTSISLECTNAACEVQEAADRFHARRWAGVGSVGLAPRARRYLGARQRDRALGLRRPQNCLSRIAHWGALCEIADHYLLKPDDRDDVLDDPRMVELALLNCFPMLDAYVPTLSARSNNESSGIVRVLHAACLATYRKLGNLDSIDIRILRAVKTDVGGYSGVTEQEASAFEVEIDRKLFQSNGDVETFAREFIEPQLRKSESDVATDVGWLRYKNAFKPLQKNLALEWLDRYPDMPRQSRETLFDICAEHAEHNELNKLIELRCSEVLQAPADDRQLSKREFWFLRVLFFLRDPPESVWDFFRSGRDTILGIEYRAGRLTGGESVGWPRLSADKVYRILDIYVDAWPKVYLPSSWGTGSPPAETAYRFLRDIIFFNQSGRASSSRRSRR